MQKTSSDNLRMCMPLQRSKDAVLKKVAQETTIFLQNNLFFLFSKRLNTIFFFFNTTTI